MNSELRIECKIQCRMQQKEARTLFDWCLKMEIDGLYIAIS